MLLWDKFTCLILGLSARHEVVGIVKEVGSNVHSFKAGDHVAVGTYVDSCRDCDDCNEGFEVQCLKRVGTFNDIDVDGSITRGGYSTFIVVNERLALNLKCQIR